ncbi:MAG TPA: mechanosensitive ion channel domain-containing protein [Chthoniobacterales bacterium]|jgi:potassium-dependent mechanosensitive channel|nr:mechanosensitive ion channel domain-containing protein [Chthoniobacterales bacterium]
MNHLPKSLLAFLTLISMAASLLAQGTASPNVSVTPNAAATPTPRATPIALPDIVAEAGAAQNTLQGINAELKADPVKTAVLLGLPDFERDIDVRNAESTRIISNGPSLDILGQLLMIWQSLGDNAKAWSRELTQRATGLGADLARLDNMAETWNLTAIEAKAKNAPPDVLNRIGQTVGLIQQTQDSLKSRRADILNLQSQLAAEQTRIQIDFSAVEQAKQGTLSRLLVRESPPIWAFRENTFPSQTTRHTFSDQVGRLEAFLAQEPGKFLVHIALIFCLYLALHWARRGMREWVKEDPTLQRSVPVFDMPIAAAIALSMLFVPVIYPSTMPRLLRAILGIAALLPAVMLLRRLLDRRAFPVLYALIILFFIDEIRAITVALPLVTRCLFIVQMLGGICFTVWLLRSRPRTANGDDVSPSLPRAGRWFVQVTLFLLGAALIGNILGYGSLSYLLGNSVLRAAYLALIFTAASRIVESLVIVAFQAKPLTYSATVRKHRPLLRRRTTQLLRLVIFLLWLSFVFNQFELSDLLINEANAVLNTGFALGAFRLSLGQIVGFILVVWASFLVSKFLRFLLEEDIYGRLKLARGLPYAISSVLHYTVLMIGFFIALAALGVDMTKFTILAGAFSVGVGFGLQNVINNFVSGLIVLFERPIKVGDVIQVGDAIGSVKKIGIRASVVHAQDGSDIIVPNGTLISSQVTNWTFSDRLRAISAQIQIPRNVDQRAAGELLKQSANETLGVVKNPAPQAFITTLGSKTLTLELRAWTDQYEDWMKIQSDLWAAINRKLENQNIELA